MFYFERNNNGIEREQIMTGLEALKNICNHCEKQMGKRMVACPFRSISNEYCEEYETIKNSLKALEIIKDKNVITHFILIWDREKYNGHLLDSKMKLSKKEYDLLKEVLK